MKVNFPRQSLSKSKQRSSMEAYTCIYIYICVYIYSIYVGNWKMRDRFFGTNTPF